MAGEADEGDPREAVDAILDGAMAGDDLGPVLAVAGAALCRAGVPIVRASLGMPAIDPTIRGLSWVWWRNDGSGRGGAGQVELVETLHGPESDEAFRASPIHHMRERDLTSCRWRLDGTAATAPDSESFPLFSELRRRGVTEFAMRLVPFGTGALIGAAFGIATDRPGGFTDADLAAADRLLPALALAAYRIGLARVATAALGAYLGGATGLRVLAGEIRRGGGRVVHAAVLLADLRGFTALAGRADPADVVGWLNEHFDAMGDPVLERGGEILKFLGDGLLAVFPVAGSGAEIEGAACTLALAAAEDALARNAALNAGRAATGGPTLGLDVALHFGEVVYGNIGTARRLDFTVIGRVVNEASRMERLCDAIGRHLLLSADFAQRCRVGAGRGCSLESLGRHVLAGVGERELFAPAAVSATVEPRDSCLG